MDQTVLPTGATITFSPDIIGSGTLTLDADAAKTKWVDGDTFQATYDVADIGSTLLANGETVPDVDITITGADDFVGNLLIPNTEEDAIDVDTENPEVDSTTVSAAHVQIQDADDGSEMVVTFEFDETMDQTVLPTGATITFSPDIIGSGTLTLDADAAKTKWVDGDTFQATYDVANTHQW